MPDIDGWEVIQKLKNDPKTAGIPVVIVSVSDEKQTGFALGAADFITKPVNRDQLIASIGNLSRVKIQSVMVVDDNDMDRKSIVQMLQGESLDVKDADGGPRCFELLEDTVPDVIVLDLMMPGMSGFEVLGQLRASPKTRNIPVIIVTAKDLTAQEKQILKEQMAPVIEKNNLTIGTFWLKLQDYLRDLNRSIPGDFLKKETEKTKILIVEDNLDTVIQVKHVLDKAGYTVSTASGGPEALEYIKHTIPDGIILDLMMPEIDGFEVLEKIRGTKETARTPVLILTAKDLTNDDFKRLSHNNIQQLVQKGDIDLDGLLFKIELMLGNQPKVSKMSPRDTTSDQRSKKALTPTKGTISGDQIDKPVLLIVEDNPDNMITLKAILKNQYNLLEAVDGEEGLQKTVQYSPDLVFLDMSLPKMDGYKVVRHIKKDTKTSTIPVVALTAHAMKGEQEKIFAAGCDDYISKPIDPDKIFECLEKWLST
jgi:CheY-like chemotaxis protein